MSRRLQVAVGLALLASVSVQPRTGAAQTSPSRDPGSEPGGRIEARQRFDRGLALYEAGDYTGALAEFQRAYELTQHAMVLYNVALVQAKLGNAAGAVSALEELKARGLAQLGRERAARAEQVYADQVYRVGTISLKYNVAAVTAQIDNVDIDPTATLRLNAGQHLLAVFTPGYAPRHVAFSVLGRGHKVVEVELTPIAESLSRVQITSDVPDVEVREAGQLLGKLPFHAALMLAPGAHELEFVRQGYAVERRSVVFPPGDTSTLHVAMRATRADGHLSLRLSEANAVVSVDGKPTLLGKNPLPLPHGRHTLRVQRAGFFDVSREVVLPPGSTVLEVRLLPTPEYLAHYVASAKRQRTIAFITGGSGLLALAGASGFLLWNQGEKNRAERAFDDYANEVAQEVAQDGSATRTSIERVNILLQSLQQKRSRDVYGWIGVGGGAAALGAATLLYLLGDDPKRYEPRPESDVFGSLRLHFDARALSVSGAY